MVTNIHPSAVVAAGAQLGAGCEIGPYCVIGEHVTLGDGCRLHAHVVLDGHTTLGAACEVFPFACLGKKTQDLKFKGEVSYVRIGQRNSIREYVTVHAATTGGNTTVVGDDCLIQAYCHIAHECQLGSRVIMSSGAMLAGHVQVGDCAVIGGMSGVVQFVRIGKMAFVGGFSKLAQDALPYCITEGIPAETRVANKVGMERNGKTPEQIRVVQRALQVLLHSGQTVERAAAELRGEFPETPEVLEMLAFAQSTERGLARPREH